MFLLLAYLYVHCVIHLLVVMHMHINLIHVETGLLEKKVQLFSAKTTLDDRQLIRLITCIRPKKSREENNEQ